MNTPFRVTLASLLLLSIESAQGQIIPDSTLPNNSLLIFPDGRTILINGGTQAGGNLFHSFQEFNINSGQFVLFNNGLDVTNIFSRVTGNNISLINGGLGANGTANLFLINPNGITFGQNAQLLLGGSFIGSTVSQVNFADGGKLDIINPNQSILTISAPIGLEFNSQKNGAIRVEGQGHNLIDFPLARPFRGRNPDNVGLNAERIFLLGGDLAFSGGLIATDGKMILGAIREGTFLLNNKQYTSNQLGNIRLNKESLIDTGNRGNALIFAEILTLQEGSVILNQNLTLNNSLPLEFNISQLEIKGLASDGLVRSGIYSENLNLGTSSSIIINARSININNGSIASSNFASSKGGNISVATQEINLLEGGIIGTFTVGNGQGGNVWIWVTQDIFTQGLSNPFGPSGIISTIGGSGQGGDVFILAKSFEILDGGISGTSVVFGEGQGGDVFVELEELRIAGLAPTPFSTFSALNSSNFADGTGGTLNLIASKIKLFDQGRITSSSFSGGQAGNLILTSNFLEISGGGGITSTVEQLPFSFSNIGDNSLTGGSGNIIIYSAILNLDQGFVSVRNDGTGDAGNIAITADNLSLTNNAQITAATASGQGGNIFLNGNNLSLNNSQITATAGGTGNGGNITLNNQVTFLLNNSQITANAFAGRGGNIQINTGVLFQDPSSRITASSELGIDGTVTINEEFNVLDNYQGLLTLNQTQNLLLLDIGCENVEILKKEDLPRLSGVTDQYSAKLTQSEPFNNLPGNAIELKDGKWVVVRYLTPEEVEALDCDQGERNVSTFPRLIAQAEGVPLIEEEAFTLKTVQFEGNRVIATPVLAQEVSGFLGKSYSPEEFIVVLQEMQNKLNALYHQQGYIFSGVFLPSGTQTEAGTVRFQVREEGELSEILITGLERIPESYLKNRINALVHTPFNLNDLAFALNTLQNDPRFESVQAELKEGRVLAISLVEAESFAVGLEGNNYNSYLVGENQLQFTASSNNLLGLADSGVIQWQHTEGSDQYSVSYGIPVNGLGGEVRLNFQQGNTILVISPFDQFNIEQVSYQAGVRYTQPVVWTPHNELTLYAGLDWRRNESTLLNEPFSFTPEIQDATTQYTSLYLGQSWIRRWDNQAFLINNELRFGVDWFDATVLDTPSGIDGLFFLWRFQAQYANAFAPNWLFRAGFFGQLTPDALLFGERVQIGGIYSVPGFAYNEFSGDNGYYGQVALEYTVFEGFKVFPYFSYGFVDNNKFVSPVPDTLASIALGLSYDRDWFYARLDYAQPLTANVRNQNILGQFGVKLKF